MPKNIEDIIVPERKRSIRNIPIPEGRRKANEYTVPFNTRPAQSVPPTPPPTSPTNQLPRYEYPPETKREEFDFHKDGRKFSRFSRKGLWVAIGLSVVLLLFAILSIFDGTTLSYVPKSTSIALDNDKYIAKKTGEGALLYSVIKLSEDKGLEVSASGEAQVSRKASGRIMVYNKATKEPQKLRATTRFQTPDGKIYKVEENVSIPGKKLVNGVEEPGSLEITVYAEKAGAEYNIGLSDFTLPGLKGSALATTIYARSKTEMSGGFVGMEKAVSAEDKIKTENTLKTALRDELLSEARAQVPEGFVLIPSLSSVTFEDLPQTESSAKNSTTLNLRGNLNGVMFKETDLSTTLARERATLAPTDTVDILELESLNFAFDGSTPTDLLLSDEIKFSVTGNATILWRTDETALKADLIGKNKKDISSILNNYPTVSNANVTVRPFWKSSFPDDGAKITVKKLDVN
ncbi:MAG: hypothetical protein AAB719_00275 [Patescibacteria group bacterium]